MLLYIIRHGETELNKYGIMQGTIDEPLNEAGKDLARMTGRAMKEAHIRFDACISSPLVRARQTARILLEETGCGDLPLVLDKRIEEVHVGAYEGIRLEEGPLSPEKAHVFFEDPFAFEGFPGGETTRDVLERTGAFLKDLAAREDDRTYLISTHGFALRALLNPLYEDPTDFWQGQVPYNCVVNVVEITGGRAGLVRRDQIFYDPKYLNMQYG